MLAGQGSGTRYHHHMAIKTNVLSHLHSFQLSVSGNQAFLATTGSLDRETIANYHMLLLASDGMGNSLTATANVFVTVGDRNDNSPQFDTVLVTKCTSLLNIVFLSKCIMHDAQFDVNSFSVDIVEQTTYLSNCFSVQVRHCMYCISHKMHILVKHSIPIKMHHA